MERSHHYSAQMRLAHKIDVTYPGLVTTGPPLRRGMCIIIFASTSSNFSRQKKLEQEKKFLKKKVLLLLCVFIGK